MLRILLFVFVTASFGFAEASLNTRQLLSQFLSSGVKPEQLKHRVAIDQLCSDIEAVYQRNRWGSSRCWEIPFEALAFSVEHRPIVQYVVGTHNFARTTIVQCAIHGDELPALPMCMNMIHEIRAGERGPPSGTRLIVQPLLNPDGMFATPPTRANSRGVDINRNFPTKDFKEHALKSWRTRDRADPRKFPGERPNSEPETQAMVKSIDEYKPQKIISIHTPLGFLDLDASGDEDHERRAQFLAINMSKNAGGYRFITFGFYPGSLGNYAGQERRIPVYTLELPPGEQRPTVDNYWRRFRVSLWRAIDFDLDSGQFINED